MTRPSPIQPLRDENLVGLILGPCSLATSAANDIADRPVGLYQAMPFDTLPRHRPPPRPLHQAHSHPNARHQQMTTPSPIQPLRDENLDGRILGPCSLATSAANDIADRPVGLYQAMPFDTLFATGLHLALFPHPLRPIISGVK